MAPSTSIAAGRQAKYGPVKLVLDGHIERPKLDIFLDRPNDALGITNMRLALDPIAAGYNYRASGGSRLGPFTSNGQILLPVRAPTVIAIAALDAGGAHASGNLTSLPGGFIGRLTLANGTLGGTLDFSPAGQKQRIDAHITAANANFPDAFSVRSGRADGIIILADDRTTIDGSVDARGIAVGRGHACPAHRQRQAGQRHRPGPRRLRRPPRRRLRFLDPRRHFAEHASG